MPWPVNFSLPLEPPLHEAISHGHIDRVMQLLDPGVDIEHHWGTTPLCRAVAKQLHGITHLLLLKGANVNADDVECWTGIMRAAEKGDKKLTRLLLLHGADPERRNHLGQTALQIAARNKHDVVMRMLVDACAGETELLLAAANGHDAVVRLLLERGVSSAVEDASGLTPLHKAAARGQEAVVRSLLQKRGRGGGGRLSRTDTAAESCGTRLRVIGTTSYSGPRQIASVAALSGRHPHPPTEPFKLPNIVFQMYVMAKTKDGGGCRTAERVESLRAIMAPGLDVGELVSQPTTIKNCREPSFFIRKNRTGQRRKQSRLGFGGYQRHHVLTPLLTAIGWTKASVLPVRYPPRYDM